MTFYTFMYIFFPRTSHRMIGYFEDEAVKSYTEYLELVESGKVLNIKAPQISIDYYKLPKDARLSDLIISVRNDEMHHSEVNHNYANNLDLSANKDSSTNDINSDSNSRAA